MSPTRRLTSALLSLLLLPVAGLAAEAPTADTAGIRHLLDRLAYGGRPGDVERVAGLGIDAWIETQLHPERLADEGLAARLAALPTLRLDLPKLFARYELPPAARRAAQQKRAELGEDASPAEKRRAFLEIRNRYAPGLVGTRREVLAELQASRLLRATYSERQLDAVLTDFWMNHFNVYARKGPEALLLGAFERDVVHPRAWGRFEDLLLATARSPAMLFYLDNWLSSDPAAAGRLEAARSRLQLFLARFRGGMTASAPPGAARGRRPARRLRSGLNENYARELMELHTLGVGGGYTQQDVREVARCFTGWTIRGLLQGRPEFAFDRRLHDPGDKIVLGHRIRSSGEREGEEVIHLLASQPATARFLATKLVRRFVADDPPAALVERAAACYRRTDGDIREVVRTIVTSPELLGAAYRDAKTKTPFELVVSALRATGAEVTDARALAARLEAMGMPLYLAEPPTGYDDTAEAWTSTSELLSRLNFAVDLATNRIRGVSVDAAALAPEAGDPRAVADTLALRLLGGEAGPATRKTLEAEAPSLAPARIAGLLLGSPEFQRR